LGTPQQVYEDPCSVNVASRLGSPRINLVPRAAFPAQAVPANVATLGVRAEHMRLHPRYVDGSTLTQCQVKRTERLSDQYLVHLGLVGSPHDVIASVPSGASFEPGEVLGLDLSQCLWFDAQGQRVRS
jgi:multiple sugar transport system ATP-binding protein